MSAQNMVTSDRWLFHVKQNLLWSDKKMSILSITENDTIAFLLRGKNGREDMAAAVVVHMVLNGTSDANVKLWAGRLELKGGEDAQTARKWANNARNASVMPRIMEAAAKAADHGVLVRHVSTIMFGENGIYGTLTNFRNNVTVLEAADKAKAKASADAVVLQAAIDARALELAQKAAAVAQDAANVAGGKVDVARQIAKDSAKEAAPVPSIMTDDTLPDAPEMVPANDHAATLEKERNDAVAASAVLETAFQDTATRLALALERITELEAENARLLMELELAQKAAAKPVRKASKAKVEQVA